MTVSVDVKGFKDLAPAGHYVALRVGFAFPIFEQNDLPQDWVQRYTGLGLMLSDPIMHWVYQTTGSVRWSEIDLADPRYVLAQAKEFGLNFGAAVAVVEKESGLRSFGSFARADREFSDDEIGLLESGLRDAHDSVAPPTNLTNAELEALGLVKDGHLMKEIADMLGVSEGAVKQRLKGAKAKLKAKTSTHAATKATSFGLI